MVFCRWSLANVMHYAKFKIQIISGLECGANKVITLTTDNGQRKTENIKLTTRKCAKFVLDSRFRQ